MSFSSVSVERPEKAFVPSPVFVGIVALTAVSAWMAWTGFGNVRVDVFLFVICGWLLSLCLHEYAHALLAYHFGDRSVADRGYLRLNPLKYTNPVLSIVLPIVVVALGGIGFPGGAVWVDHTHIRGKARESLISLAGPATNALLAILIAVPFWIGGSGRITFTGTTLIGAHADFWVALASLGFLQVVATVLNFIPVPGLDGGNIIRPWLSERFQRYYAMFAPYGFILLFIVIWQSRPVNQWFFSTVSRLADLIGIPALAGEIGLLYWMRFWQS